MGSTVKILHNDTLMILLYCDLEEHSSNEVVTPRSPVGQLLRGKEAGDVFEARVPGGVAKIKVLEVDNKGEE